MILFRNDYPVSPLNVKQNFQTRIHCTIDNSGIHPNKFQQDLFHFIELLH
jgi:hypothetical protein